MHFSYSGRAIAEQKRTSATILYMRMEEAFCPEVHEGAKGGFGAKYYLYLRCAVSAQWTGNAAVCVGRL